MSLTEPVDVGLVASLARAGGNVTGVTYGVNAEIFGKQLALIKEAMPRVQRVAVLSDPSIPTQPLMIKGVTTAARSLDVQLHPVEARAPGEFDPAFAAMGRERVGALVVLMGPMMFLHRARLANAAMTHRLPSVSTQAPWAEAGGLMSYGPNLLDVYRRAATYVDKILKGAKPADLPIEQPTRFDLCREPQDCKGARPHHPAVAAAAGGSGHRNHEQRG